jgi:hypothetical protein
MSLAGQAAIVTSVSSEFSRAVATELAGTDMAA